MRETLTPGLTGSLESVVTEERTVPQLLPEIPESADMPPVLATGWLVGLCEWTCVRAIADHLDDGEQTLGIHVDLSHEGPTAVGERIRIEAELVSVDGRVLEFEVEAADPAGVVCRGRHRRAVVDAARFRDRLAKR